MIISKAPLERSTFLAILLATAFASSAGAHSGARSKEIEIGNEIRLGPGSIEVRQIQSYTGRMADSLMAEVDSDRDGRVSDAERAAGEREGARQFSEAMGVEVDWLPAEPLEVTASFLSFPAVRPAAKAQQQPAVVSVLARYRFPAGQGVRVFSLVLSLLNAYEITGSLELQAPLRAVKTNSGHLEAGGAKIAGMLSTNTAPESFQALFISSGEPGPAALSSTTGVPSWAAALAGALFFLAGLYTARKQRQP